MSSGNDRKDDRFFRASDDCYRMLAESSRDLIFVVDKDLNHEYVNPIAAASLGKKPADIIGRNWLDFFPEDEFPKQVEYIRQVLRTGEPVHVEFDLDIPDLEKHLWLSTTLTPMMDDGGNVKAVMGVSRDITHLKETELSLKASEKLYRMLAEAAQDFIYIIDDKGIVSYVNDHGARMFGTERAEIEGKHIETLFAPKDAGRQLSSIRSVIEADMPMYIESNVVLPMGEMWLGTSLSPLKDDDGKITSVLGISRNISAKKKTADELLAERDFSDTAINSMPGIFYLIDVEGHFVRWNRTFEEVTGYAADEMEKMNPLDFFAGDEKKLIEARIHDVFVNGEAEAEADLISKDGIGTRYYFTGYRMKVGQKDYLVGVGTDISRLRKAEEDLNERNAAIAAERDRAKKYLYITPAMMVALDRDGTVNMINDKGCELLGCTPKGIIGRDWFDNFIPEEIRSEVREVFFRLMSGEVEPVDHYTNTVIDQNGKRREIAWHNTVIYDQEGNITGTLSSGEDITDRLQAEKMLRESEQRFKTMFDVAITGILLANVETKRFVLSNDAMSDMLGYSHEEIARMSVADIHPEEALPRVVEAFEKQARGELKISRDLPVVRKDGSIFLADVSAALVSLAGVDYLMGYFSDSTDRYEAEQALVASEEKYRTLFEESNDVIFISAPEGRLLEINPAGIKLFGYDSREEMMKIDIGKELFRDVDERLRYQEEIESNGEVTDYEMRLLKKNGAEIIVSVTAKAVRDESGEVSAYRGIMRDITEQRLLESQLIQSQKMESIGNLAGGVAHDFNNYLTAIQGYADLALLENPESGALHDYLNEIRGSSARAADLTRQLLLFGRRQEIDLKPVDLVSTVTNLQKMLSRLIGERFTIATRLAGNLDTVMADKGLVEQVIVNLVVNARDSMADGGEIAIEAFNIKLGEQSFVRAAGLPAGDYVQLKVADQGCGIDEEASKHIFEPFFTTKEIGKGTGLGLSVVYGIVAQHHGLIEVESEVGFGTAFNIYLPVMGEREKIYASRPPEDAKRKGGGTGLLLVEDDDAVRNLALRILADNGYDVSAATCAAEARQLFARSSAAIDIVFSDVVLPDGNGLELVESLQKEKPGLGIVLASGYTGEDVDRHQIEAKGFIFIQKPYTLARMVEVIGQLVKS